jgi:DNA-binding MarR family transcriptional regulator
MQRHSAQRTNPEDVREEARRLLLLLETLGRRNSLRDPLASAIEALEFTPQQVHAVMWVGTDGRLPMGELAQRLGVTEKTITGIVDRLEREGYLRRERPESDRRVVQVVLTEKGLSAYQDLSERALQKTTDFLTLLEPEDRDALLRILQRLLEKLTPAQADGATTPSPKTP